MDTKNPRSSLLEMSEGLADPVVVMEAITGKHILTYANSDLTPNSKKFHFPI